MPWMLGIPEAYIGHAAGLATSDLRTATSLLFTSAGRRIGVTPVNALRIGAAIVLLALTHAALSPTHRIFPDALPRQVLLLAISGLIGLCIGDQALFTAFLDIGPRLALLSMTTAPIMAAVIGWLVLGENLPAVAVLGIGLTLTGVAWVILQRPPAQPGQDRSRYARGVALALLAAACQAGGLLLSKQGMGEGWLPKERSLDPQAAALVRMTFAGIGMVPLVALHAWRERRRNRENDFAPQHAGSCSLGLLLALGGAVLGPYLGMWYSLIATKHAPLAVAQTLFALPPVLILPFTRWLYREQIGWRAVLGALVALAGVTLLFALKSPVTS